MKIKNIKNKIIIIVVALIFIFTSAYLTWGNSKEEYVRYEVKKDDISQTINETGELEAPKRVSLSFSASGNLDRKLVEEGDVVEKGDVLAELNYLKLYNEKQRALHGLEVAQAELDKVLAGSSQETLEISEAQLSQAKQNYESYLQELDKTEKEVAEDIKQAQDNLRDLRGDEDGEKTFREQAIENAKLNLKNVKEEQEQNIINTKESTLSTVNSKLPYANVAIDKVDKILDDDDLNHVFSAKSYEIKNIINNIFESPLPVKAEVSLVLEEAQENESRENINEVLSLSIEYMEEVAEILDYTYQGLENTVTSSNFNQAKLDLYKNDVNTQINQVNSTIEALKLAKRTLDNAYLNYDNKISLAQSQLEEAQTSLSEAIKNARNKLTVVELNAEQKISSLQAKAENAMKSWEVAEKKYNEVKSGARVEDINLVYAKLRQAQSSVDIIDDQIDDYIIYSPIAGEIINFNPEIGEQVGLGEPVVSILGSEQYQIVVNIPEVYINDIEVGDDVKISLDTFGKDKIFKGEVFFIGTDEKLIQDLIYYETKVKFIDVSDSDLERMKPKMTANISIDSNNKKDVLVVLARAIKEEEKENGEIKKYLRIIDENNDIEERQVETGLQGDDGFIEVLNGVDIGEKIIVD
jgi:multidrug efflux pump subunit AcrA (membrane-fusion protein)